MRKRIVISAAAITAIAFMMFAVIALGAGRIPVASAHAQAPAVQAQLTNLSAGPAQTTQDTVSANGTENAVAEPGETPESAKDNGQDSNLPGGGHQDQGQVDHQFEGTE